PCELDVCATRLGAPSAFSVCTRAYLSTPGGTLSRGSVGTRREPSGTAAFAFGIRPRSVTSRLLEPAFVLREQGGMYASGPFSSASVCWARFRPCQHPPASQHPRTFIRRRGP